MPLYRRLPKRGFNPVNRINIAKINLNKIQILIEKKTLPSDKIISMELLKKNRVVGNKFSKIKLLGSGDLKSKIDFEVDYASKSVIKKLVITDTIDNQIRVNKAKNIEVLTVSNLMGEAIKRISNSTSVSDLFK